MRELTSALYRATQALQDHMGSVAWAAYTIGDSVMRASVDVLADAADADRWRRTIAQLANNLSVFRLVKDVNEVLDIPATGVFELADLVERAYALGQYPDLWAVEGLGHVYADRYWQEGDRFHNILDNEHARGIPRSSLTMLHAGVGLSLARHVLGGATPFDAPEEFRARARLFVEMCRENALPGYEGAAIESLGLVTRTWHAQLMRPLDASLRETDARAREHFWHGAGRALYFHPFYIVPGALSPWRATDDEPPDQIARLNMKAGLAWATVLVNCRQPDILVQLIRERGASLVEDDAFASGVAAAIVMASDVTPGDEYIEALAGYSPETAPDVASRWEALIGAPSRSGLLAQPVLAEAGGLGEVFRYQRFPDWFERAGHADRAATRDYVH